MISDAVPIDFRCFSSPPQLWPPRPLIGEINGLQIAVEGDLPGRVLHGCLDQSYVVSDLALLVRLAEQCQLSALPVCLEPLIGFFYDLRVKKKLC